MNEEQYSGGAKPAIAAHSKDASAPGQTPASSGTGDDREAGSARDGIESLKTAVRKSAGNARETLAGQGSRAGDQVSTFVQEQPLTALAITGIAFFALGALLARR